MFSRTVIFRIATTIIVALIGLFTFQGSGPATVQAQGQAQPGTFEAILYNSGRGEFIAVNNTGTELERTTLPSLGSQTFSDEVEVSDDGNRIAYVLTDTNSNAKDLMIYDRTQATIVGTYRIPAPAVANTRVYHSVDFRVRSSAFDPATNRFALGYSINNRDWHLVVYNISQGQAISTIDHTTHPNLQIGNGDTPMVRQFDGQFVDFTMLATGTEGFPEYPAFRWNIQNNTIQQNPVFRDLGSDYLGTDHVLTVPDYDFANVNDQIRSPFPQVNTIYAAPNDTGSTFPVYNSQRLTLYAPRFIENGRRVAVTSGTVGSGGQAGWLVVDRSGAQVGRLGIGNLNPHELLGLPGGLLYSASASDIRDATGYLPSPNADTTALMYIPTDPTIPNDAGTRIWLGEVNQFPELTWVSERQNPALPLPSTWTQLQPSGSTGPPPVVEDPCIADPTLCELRVGIQAEINTTQGDRLNMRSAPGTGYDILTQLPNNEVVTIAEGPVDAQGFTWWRIETPGDQTGWVVERVNDIQTLITRDTATTRQPAQLRIGGQARVTSEGDNLNARSDPNANSTVLAVLREGDVLSVLDGPRQGTSFTWWQVETSVGPAWVADGNATETWLQPLP